MRHTNYPRYSLPFNESAMNTGNLSLIGITFELIKRIQNTSYSIQDLFHFSTRGVVGFSNHELFLRFDSS
jgi:hypothetical protein